MAKAKIDYSIERQVIGGTYRKRLNDAFEAFDSLKVDKLSPEIALIFYFLTCEKIAKIMIGIYRRQPGRGPKFAGMKWRCSDLISAAKFVGCDPHISGDDIRAIFIGEQINRFSANALRNRVFHDFGPTHLKEARAYAPGLIKTMKRFLACRESIIRTLGTA